MSELKQQEIRVDGVLIALVLRDGDYPDGLKFYGKEEDFLQVGTWSYTAGQKLRPHSHKVFDRVAQRTQELVMVKKGLVKSHVYDEDDNIVEELILKEGDCVIYLGGGHDFEILEDDTQVFEVKNGPFLGVERDKRNINK